MSRPYALASFFIGAVLFIGLVACVTDSNRCVPGLVYAPALKACVADNDGSVDASTDATVASDGEATSEGGADAASSGLGTACGGDPECAGHRASYCLKNPSAPSDPGICTIPQCSAADCGADYACCDCGNASVDALKSLPRGVCFPRAQVSAVQPIGCVCQ